MTHFQSVRIILISSNKKPGVRESVVKKT